MGICLKLNLWDSRGFAFCLFPERSRACGPDFLSFGNFALIRMRDAELAQPVALQNKRGKYFVLTNAFRITWEMGQVQNTCTLYKWFMLQIEQSLLYFKDFGFCV